MWEMDRKGMPETSKSNSLVKEYRIFLGRGNRGMPSFGPAAFQVSGECLWPSSEVFWQGNRNVGQRKKGKC